MWWFSAGDSSDVFELLRFAIMSPRAFLPQNFIAVVCLCCSSVCFSVLLLPQRHFYWWNVYLLWPRPELPLGPCNKGTETHLLTACLFTCRAAVMHLFSITCSTDELHIFSSEHSTDHTDAPSPVSFTFTCISVHLNSDGDVCVSTETTLCV